MKKLFLNLEVIDGYPPVSMESIWAEETEEGYLKINNIPFYSKEVSFGDIVSVIQKEENYLLYDKTIIYSKIVHCGLFSLMKIRNLKIKY